MRFLGLLLVSLGFITNQSLTAQQLIINEISQGTGIKEYVEFIVAGNPSCQSTVPCLDLRGVVVDDNNGHFASGSGTGIAAGAVRFANTTFWSCIPQGTLILIYNMDDINPAVPPIDISMSDGNCRLIIPVNSTLLEGQSISPTSSVSTYPSSSSWVAGASVWAELGMSNSNDSFQIRSSITATAPSFSVSWGNNTTNATIYFTSAAGSCFSFTNDSDNDPLNQANWTQGAVGSDETPGAANSPENASWIGGMNPQCGVATGMNVITSSTDETCTNSCDGFGSVSVTGGVSPYQYSWSTGATTNAISSLCVGTYTVQVTDVGGCTIDAQITIASSNLPLNVTINKTDETCLNACNGDATASITGGTSPYDFSWSNGVTTANNPNLCAGTYSIIVTDQNGCSGTGTTTILAGPAPQDPTIQSAGPFTNSDSPIQLTSNSAGGTWTSDCGSCLSATGVFSPQISGVGTFQICYSVGTGACLTTDCMFISVTQGCTTDQTDESATICPEGSVAIFGNQESTAGDYSMLFTNQGGCDSTHTFHLSVFQTFPTDDVITFCEGDSVLVFGVWRTHPDDLVETITDMNGCTVTNTVKILTQNCELDDFTLFVPNVFTPNGDNVNDVFTFELTGAQLDAGYIINRWGNVIFEFDQNNLSWNGRTQDGLIVNDGVYTYVLEYTPTGGSREKAHGFVTVLR